MNAPWITYRPELKVLDCTIRDGGLINDHVLGRAVTCRKRIAALTHRIKGDAHATLSLLAILEYRHKNGFYPENLEALVGSGLLKTVPIDPYSDKPFVYKRTDEGFTLYSVGLNLTDDGGEFGRNKKGEIRVWADESDAVFWPVQTK